MNKQEPLNEDELLSIDTVNIRSLSNTASLSCIQTVSDFHKSLKKGEESEKLLEENEQVANFYGSTTIVSCTTQDPKWRLLGVDFIVIDPKGNRYLKVESKTGISKDGNSIVIEFCDDIETGHAGWYYHTCSDIVVFYNKEHSGQIAIFWHQFFDWFESIEDKKSQPYITYFSNDSSWFHRTAKTKCAYINVSMYETIEKKHGRTVPWLMYNIKTGYQATK